MEGLRTEKAQAETADDLDAFAAGNERLGEWLTVSKQYLYLVALTMKGAKERYGEPDEKTLERIRYELGTIEWMGFPGYFLIVSDFIRAAREMGVSVGPGRGSAAGSVVAYCLKITNIDPLKYDLLFERFLNPDRISLPDVDVDFDEDGRADVLRYVIEKYGKKRVAQIVTFGTMAPKLAIRDVARVEKLPLADSDRLAKLVPDKLMVEKGETPFERAYKDSPELARERESPNPLIQNTLKYAEKLEGSVRQTGVHACGVIIGKDDLEEFAPVATAKDADLNVVQYEGKLVESVGLIKMDFLGLKTLSIIKDAVENVRRVQGINLDIDNIPLDDRKTYQLFCKGETTGIFQFESAGMKKIPPGSQTEQARRPDSHERPLPSGPHGQHSQLHRPQARPGEGGVRISGNGRISGGHLRYHGLSGAGHAAVAEAGRIHRGARPIHCARPWAKNSVPRWTK